MIFNETRLKGAYIISPQVEEEAEGFVTSTFNKKEFAHHGLNSTIVQCSISHNKKRGTFRGMRFQAPPFEDEKIIRCLRGAILCVLVDLRSRSDTFKENVQVELSEDNNFMLYVPKSFALGFLVLRDNTQVLYQMTEYDKPRYTWGFRYDDPAFGISLPFDVTTISEEDKSYPDLYLLPA